MIKYNSHRNGSWIAISRDQENPKSIHSNSRDVFLVLGEFIGAQLRPVLENSHFLNKAYVKEYQHATAGEKPCVPGYHYMQLYHSKHFQSEELYDYIDYMCMEVVKICHIQDMEKRASCSRSPITKPISACSA